MASDEHTGERAVPGAVPAPYVGDVGPYVGGSIEDFIDTASFGITGASYVTDTTDGTPKWQIGVQDAMQNGSTDAYSASKVHIRQICMLPPPTIGYTAFGLQPLQGGPPQGANEAVGDPMAGQYGFLDYTLDFTWAYNAWVKYYYFESDSWSTVDTDWLAISRPWNETDPATGELLYGTISSIPGNGYTEWNKWYWEEGWATYATAGDLKPGTYGRQGYVCYDESIMLVDWFDQYSADGVVDDNLHFYSHELAVLPSYPSSETGAYAGFRKTKPTLESTVGDWSSRFRTTYKWDDVPDDVIDDLRTRFKIISTQGVVTGMGATMDDWLDTQYAAIAASLYYSVVPKQFTAKMQKAEPISEEDLSALITYSLASNTATTAADTTTISTGMTTTTTDGSY